MTDRIVSHAFSVPPPAEYLLPDESDREAKAFESAVDEAEDLCDSEGNAFVEHDFRRRMGTYGLLTLVLGTCAILAATGFLGFLWTSGPSNSTWHKIVTSNWVARSTVISALVIRTAVAAQTVLCTSMIAAILLQRKGVGLPRVVTVSMARAFGLPPHWLAWVVLNGHFYVSDTFAIFLVVLLFLTSTASQFTSTVLLSGVEVSITDGANKLSNFPTQEETFCMPTTIGSATPDLSRLLLSIQPWLRIKKSFQYTTKTLARS